jgi:hypothetical protein
MLVISIIDSREGQSVCFMELNLLSKIPVKKKKTFCFFFFFFFAEVRKILFVENLVGEKRRERLHVGECRGTQKPVIPSAALKGV